MFSSTYQAAIGSALSDEELIKEQFIIKLGT